MMTTERVGDPVEDASMAVMRPILSKINALGLVTSDSQAGKITKPDKFGVSRQRAYISGMMDRSYAKEFVRRANLVDGLLAFWCEFKDYIDGQPEQLSPSSIPVKFNEDNAGTIRYETYTPQEILDFTTVWWNLLPETGLCDDVSAMNRVKKGVVHVRLVDMIWCRQRWLFNKVVELLQDVTPSFEVVKRGR
jgi:hypothetical protein